MILKEKKLMRQYTSILSAAAAAAKATNTVIPITCPAIIHGTEPEVDGPTDGRLRAVLYGNYYHRHHHHHQTIVTPQPLHHHHYTSITLLKYHHHHNHAPPSPTAQFPIIDVPKCSPAVRHGAGPSVPGRAI